MQLSQINEIRNSKNIEPEKYTICFFILLLLRLLIFWVLASRTHKVNKDVVPAAVHPAIRRRIGALGNRHSTGFRRRGGTVVVWLTAGSAKTYLQDTLW